jgi:cytochrome c
MTRPTRTVALTGLLLLGLATGGFAATPSGDAVKGQDIFKQRCGICHSTDTTGGPSLGPNLRGVVGRKAGSAKDFQSYTPALIGSKLTLDLKTLDGFLIAPMTKVPGTTMPMSLPDATERADVIAFLAALK